MSDGSNIVTGKNLSFGASEELVNKDTPTLRVARENYQSNLKLESKVIGPHPSSKLQSAQPSRPSSSGRVPSNRRSSENSVSGSLKENSSLSKRKTYGCRNSSETEESAHEVDEYAMTYRQWDRVE